MAYTAYNRSAHSLRALALSVLRKLDWRHHGIGALQGYVSEGGNPEVRLHIWSRKLLKPGMDLSGDVHDHRFNMTSHVLCGTVLHEEWIETEDPAGEYAMMALTHARAAADTNYHGPTMPLPGRFSVRKVLHTIQRGYSYDFGARKFHRSPLPETGGVAVTCVEKHAQTDEPARLLYPMNREPVMAFGHPLDRNLIACILNEAEAALRGIET